MQQLQAQSAVSRRRALRRQDAQHIWHGLDRRIYAGADAARTRTPSSARHAKWSRAVGAGYANAGAGCKLIAAVAVSRVGKGKGEVKHQVRGPGRVRIRSRAPV